MSRSLLYKRALQAAAIGFALTAFAAYILHRMEAAQQNEGRAERASSSKARMVLDAAIPKERMPGTKRNAANIVEIFQSARKSAEKEAQPASEVDAAKAEAEGAMGSHERDAIQRKIDEIDASLKDNPFNSPKFSIGGKHAPLDEAPADKDQP